MGNLNGYNKLFENLGIKNRWDNFSGTRLLV